MQHVQPFSFFSLGKYNNRLFKENSHKIQMYPSIQCLVCLPLKIHVSLNRNKLFNPTEPIEEMEDDDIKKQRVWYLSDGNPTQEERIKEYDNFCTTYEQVRLIFLSYNQM